MFGKKKAKNKEKQIVEPPMIGEEMVSASSGNDASKTQFCTADEITGDRIAEEEAVLAQAETEVTDRALSTDGAQDGASDVAESARFVEQERLCEAGEACDSSRIAEYSFATEEIAAVEARALLEDNASIGGECDQSLQGQADVDPAYTQEKEKAAEEEKKSKNEGLDIRFEIDPELMKRIDGLEQKLDMMLTYLAQIAYASTLPPVYPPYPYAPQQTSPYSQPSEQEQSAPRQSEEQTQEENSEEQCVEEALETLVEAQDVDSSEEFDALGLESLPEAPVAIKTSPDEWLTAVDVDHRIKPKFTFDMKLRIADDDIKGFYSDIKNELLSYGIKNRMSRHKENFNKGRNQIARMAINGKTLVVYLAIDPSSVDERYYHQIDVSAKKGVAEMPSMIKVRSKVAARKVKELIAIICENLVIKKKKGFEAEDFAADLSAEGYTTVQCKGFDFMVNGAPTLEEVKRLPDSFAAQLIEVVQDDRVPERWIKTTLSLDDLACFQEGDTVDIEAVRAHGLGAVNANFLRVTEGSGLDRKLHVFAHEYTPDAVKMICMAGGEAYLIVQPDSRFAPKGRDAAADLDDEENDEDE